MSTSQGIKLDEKTKARLKVLAEKRNRSSHWLMKAAIESYLDREENYEHEKAEDMARWEQYVITGKAVPGEKVASWLEDLSKGKNGKWQR